MPLDDGVALARLDPLAAAPVERNEVRLAAFKVRRHPHLVQVHREMDERTGLEAEQPRFGRAILPVLADGVLVCLPRRLALHFDGGNGESVHEDDMIDDLAVGRPDLAGDGKDVLLPRGDNGLLVRRVRRRIEEVEVRLPYAHAMLERVDEASALRDAREVDRLRDRLVALRLVDTREFAHLVRLGRFKKLDKQPLVERVRAAVVGVRAEAERRMAVGALRQALDEESLVVLLVHEFPPVHFAPPTPT